MKTVFVDVDTQIDFLFPAGALYVPGAERLLSAIARLNHFAAAQGIPLISTTDAHSENDPEFRQWPPHCVAGTSGQLKPGETLLASRTTLGFQPGALIELAPQIIVEKQALDVFTNPNFTALLDSLKADRYVVYGVATDYCVRCAITGLLATGKPVILVTDAIAAVKPEDGARTLDELTARGGALTTVSELTN
jgi:nicotinamidase/pyrazinamidase